MKKIILIAVLILFLFGTVSFVQSYEFAITIPDQHTILVRDTLCLYWDYNGNKRPGETQVQFIERMFQERIRQIVNTIRAETAANVAENAVVPLVFE